MSHKPDDKSVYYFVGIDRARFKRPVVPGDQLDAARSRSKRMRAASGSSTARARVDEPVVAEAELMCTLRAIERQDVREPAARRSVRMTDPSHRDRRSRRAAGRDVEVGAYTMIGEHVEIGAGCRIGPHVVITGHTRIGANNRIFQFARSARRRRTRSTRGEPTRLEIGDRNTIREFCTFNRGTAQDAGVTRLGNDNWIMAYVHIAHDCQVGNHTIFANNAQLAGHVHVGDYAILGGFTGVHQFCQSAPTASPRSARSCCRTCRRTSPRRATRRSRTASTPRG